MNKHSCKCCKNNGSFVQFCDNLEQIITESQYFQDCVNFAWLKSSEL